MEEAATAEHFSALRELHRAADMGPEQRELLWRGLLRGAKLAYIPLETVVEGYQGFLRGEAKASSLRIAADEVIPGVVRVQIAWKNTPIAAHPAPARRLLELLIPIWIRAADSQEEAIVELLELLDTAWRAR